MTDVIVPRASPQPLVVGSRSRTRIVVAYQGAPGRDGASLSGFEHVQGSASALWTVNHSLGRTPASVRVLSPGGMEVEAEVLNISNNQLQVGFAIPATGRVIVI